MTNKPMLSVERELLESCWSALMQKGQVIKALELRALLDKPCCDHEFESPVLSSMPDYCAKCHADKPAAQHQGEPVALQHIAVSEGGVLRWMTGRKMQDCELYAMPDGSAIRSNLYAAQHAPLKIGSGVTVENIGFGPEEERKPYLVFGSYGCLTEVNLIDVSLVSKRQAHTIADLEAIGVRVEQPAPVAVADFYEAFRFSEIVTDDQAGELAEIAARLNGVKP